MPRIDAMRPPESVRVGTLGAAPASVRRGRVWVAGYPPDLMPDLVLVGGGAPGPVLAVVAGLHGDEGAAVEAALRLAREVEPAALCGVLALVPVANAAAFRDRRPFVNPLDGQDLERLFPGAPRGGPSVRLAHALFDQVVGSADAVVDLHGGGLVEAVAPFALAVPGGPAATESVALAQAFGLPRLVAADMPGSLVAAAASVGKPALRATAGSHGRGGRAAVRALADGVRGVLAALGMLATAGPQASSPATAVAPARWLWLEAPVDGYWRPHLRPGRRVRAGQALGTLTPRTHGVAPIVIRAPADGEALLVVDHLAARARSPLAALSVPDVDAGAQAR